MNKIFPTQGLCFTIIKADCESSQPALDATNVLREGRLRVGTVGGCSNQMGSLGSASPNVALASEPPGFQFWKPR